MELQSEFMERSSCDRRSGKDRRLEDSVIECLQHYGISVLEQSIQSRRREERRKGERRAVGA